VDEAEILEPFTPAIRPRADLPVPVRPMSRTESVADL